MATHIVRHLRALVRFQGFAVVPADVKGVPTNHSSASRTARFVLILGGGSPGLHINLFLSVLAARFDTGIVANGYPGRPHTRWNGRPCQGRFRRGIHFRIDLRRLVALNSRLESYTCSPLE